MAAAPDLRRIITRLTLALSAVIAVSMLVAAPALAQVGLGSAPTGGGLPAPVTQAAAPVTQAAAPVTQAAAPVTQAAAPVTQAAAPVTQAAAPVTQAAAPVTQAAAPVTQAAAPVTQAAAPVVQAAMATVVSTAAPALEAAAPLPSLVETTTLAVKQTAAPVAHSVSGLDAVVLAGLLEKTTGTVERTVRVANDPLARVGSNAALGADVHVATERAELATSAPTSDVAARAISVLSSPTRVAPATSTKGIAIPISMPTRPTTVFGARPAHTQDASHASVSAGPAKTSRAQPRIPSGPLGPFSTLQSMSASAGSSALLILLATMVAAFILAIPSLGRWLRPTADICRPPGFVAQLELPG